MVGVYVVLTLEFQRRHGEFLRMDVHLLRGAVYTETDTVVNARHVLQRASYHNQATALGIWWLLGVGTPDRIRTCNPWVRSPVLYPLSYRRAVDGRLCWMG